MVVLTVSFGTPPYSLKSATLPSGLSATLTGNEVSISGMYDAAGMPVGYLPQNFTVVVVVEDSSVPKLEGTFAEAIQLKTRDWNWTYTTDMEVTIDTQNGSNLYYNEPSQLETPYMGEDSAQSPNFSMVSAPTGWTLIKDIHTRFMGFRGTVSGSGKGVGTSFNETVSIRATDGGAAYDRTYTGQVTLQVRPPKIFPADGVLGLPVNTPCQVSLYFSGGNGKLTQAQITGLPTGITYTLDNSEPRSKVLLSGTPTASGTVNPTFTLTDAEGNVWIINNYPVGVT